MLTEQTLCYRAAFWAMCLTMERGILFSSFLLPRRYQSFTVESTSTQKTRYRVCFISLAEHLLMPHTQDYDVVVEIRRCFEYSRFREHAYSSLMTGHLNLRCKYTS